MYILREKRPTGQAYPLHLPVCGPGIVARHDDSEAKALALLIHLAGTQLLSISLRTSLDRTKWIDSY
jgi:hypothetical protein